jgi:hypothetical protein
MVFPWAFAAQVGVGIAGSRANKSANTKARQRGKKTIFRQIAPRLTELYDKQEDSLINARDTAGAGYDAALTETQGINRVGQRRILERERSELGSSDQNLTSRGLTGTTVRNSVRRGIRSNTSRMLDEHNARFAQMRSSLHTGKGNTLAAREADLAKHYGLRWDVESRDIYNPLFQLRTGGGGNWSPIDSSGLGTAINNDIIPWIQGIGEQPQYGPPPPPGSTGGNNQ